MEQITVCLNGLKETLAVQEKLTDKVVKELSEYGAVSTKTALELERSRQSLRDSKVLLSQVEEVVTNK